MSDLVTMIEAADRAGVVPMEPSTGAIGKAALSNRAWETFAQVLTGWVGGDPCSSTDAYLAAYPKSRKASARANAARLLTRPEVKARARYLRGQLSESVLADASAIRRRLLLDRQAIIEKTLNTKHKALALEAMRDLERSLGLDGPEVEREEVVTKTVDGEILKRVQDNISDAMRKVSVRIEERTTIHG